MAVLVLAGASACSHAVHHPAAFHQPEAVYHQVRRGDNLYRIAKAYSVSVKRLVNVNHLTDPSRLEVGQRLLIPDAQRELPVDLITPRAANVAPPSPDGASAATLAFIWPV